MKRIWRAYKDLLGIIFAEAPAMVIIAFIAAIASGLVTPATIYIKQQVIDGGLKVASGTMTFGAYSLNLVFYVLTALLPYLINGVIWNFVEPRSQLILRTVYKARLIRKLKTMKYEHFENEETAEIIDKAYYRAEGAARHLWPMYVYYWLSSSIASIGSLIYLGGIKWWLLFPALIPFIIETYLQSRVNYNIYLEMEKYWKQERKYETLGEYLQSRGYSKELKAFGNAEYLIDVYKTRMNERNREYERYYFKNLRKILASGNLTRFAALGNVIILLFLFVSGDISVGLFIAVTTLMFGSFYESLSGSTYIFRWAPFHINFYEYYDKFFRLSDEPAPPEGELPEKYDIELKDIWFRYPGTDRNILKGLSMKVSAGEKASLVGENGAGKSTLIKLLLGLFTPDKGEIIVGGKNLNSYPLSQRTKIFGPVFQDFSRYSITVQENIGIGDVEHLDDERKIKAAAVRGEADTFIQKLPAGYDTLLGRDFPGGVDLSGGEWQRIAISRAFMGDKPVLLLDEPTSQLDPVAEAGLYSEFAQMAAGKTALFITHRLASTMITDRIFVISDGKIAETGTHDELMARSGIYAEMFNAQKQWYKKAGEGNGNGQEE